MAKHTTSSSKSQAPNPGGPKPAPPTYRILDDYPITMKRPLCLIDGRGYAAAWLPVSILTTEVVDSNGILVILNPPVEKIETKLVIIREDGVVFGVNSNNPLAALDFAIELPERPPTRKMWRPKAVTEFEKGARPIPANLFQSLTEVIGYFIDFTRSLADQRTMSEFVACFILTTWFLDAFNVIGFLWPNGERGSGKTNLLNIVADLSYLGQIILSGGSYASLRDMADNGATLAFDDAEILSDPRKSDPDKRALLLAGNRRGVTVTLKEPDGKKGWKTRYVNAFCPRMFSAINLPDPVLASRTIVIPLIRTTDSQRASRDPAEHSRWPHDLHQLLDDLWALATNHLAEMKKWDQWVEDNSPLLGRALQPWRAILAVAAWLEDKGVQGVWQRMQDLSMSYQQERPEFETSDFTSLVIHALLECANSAISAISANKNQKGILEFQVSEVTNSAIKLARQDDWDIDTDFITPRRVGRVLSQLRFQHSPRPGGKGSRRRKASISELEELSLSYNVPLPHQLAQYIVSLQQPPTANGPNGPNGSNGPTQTSEHQTLDDLLRSAPIPDTNKPCVSCGKMDWISYPNNGGFYCGTCHPK